MRKLVICIGVAISSLALQAQDLPQISPDPAIQVGTLPNGLSYYIVPNEASHGYVDYAIVQKVALSNDDARHAMVSFPNMKNIVPYRYLSSKAVGYGPDGYFKSYGTASSFRFEKVPVADVATSDTTLMILFGLCNYSPYEQAVVISGDVDPANLKGKMSIFSLMVSPRQKAPEPKPYEWHPTEMQYDSYLLPSGSVASLSVTFRSPRIPKAQIGTVQKLVSSRLYYEFSQSLKNRLTDAFREERIPLAGVNTNYYDSSCSCGDEEFTVRIDVGKKDVRKALCLLSEVLYCLDKKGVGEKEMAGLQKLYMTSQVKIADGPHPSNSYYLNKCISSYLYGTDLGSVSAAKDFFLTKDIPVETEAKLLSDFVGDLINPRFNVSLCIESPDIEYPREEMLSLFLSAWSSADSERHYSPAGKVELPFPANKQKVKTETQEPMSGGTIWTFSNGMRVIFKQDKTVSGIHYAMIVKGSYSSIKTIAPQEGPFLSDALQLLNIGGNTPEQFSRYLQENGIDMHVNADISALTISGTAPSGSLAKLMESLLAVSSSDNTVNKESSDYYKKCEALRLDLARKGYEGQMASVDSIMRPGYQYSPFKKLSGLTNYLEESAMSYIDRQFSRTNDGVIVLIANQDPEVVKKELSRYVGGFGVSKGFSVRPDLSYQLRAGWSTYLLEDNDGEGNSINVVMSTLMPITSKRYMAFKVAQLIFERELVNTLSRYGMWVDIRENVEFVPMERMSLIISIRPVTEEGLPEGISVRNPVTTLAAVRASLELACHKAITASEIAIYKSILLNQVGYDSKVNEGLINDLILRYAEGKDLVSQYKEVIGSMTSESIQEVLSALTEGSKIEFVVK